MEISNLQYKDLLNLEEFEYFFRFKKENDNFEELWKMKSTAREALNSWLMGIRVSESIAEVISNTASELIENCIKYSIIGTSSFVLIFVCKNIITIETINLAEADHKSNVVDFINYINSSEKTTAEIYLEKITEATATNESRLGLLKIKMETDGLVNLCRTIKDEKNVVHLYVEMPISEL